MALRLSWSSIQIKSKWFLLWKSDAKSNPQIPFMLTGEGQAPKYQMHTSKTKGNFQ